MMNVGLDLKDMYDDFDPLSTYFFKMGSHGLVCFHGKNYSIKQRLTAEQTSKLITNPMFHRISTNCYVNLRKIYDIKDNVIMFRDDIHGIKTINVPKRNLEQIRRLRLDSSETSDEVEKII